MELEPFETTWLKEYRCRRCDTLNTMHTGPFETMQQVKDWYQKESVKLEPIQLPCTACQRFTFQVLVSIENPFERNRGKFL